MKFLLPIFILLSVLLDAQLISKDLQTRAEKKYGPFAKNRFISIQKELIDKAIEEGKLRGAVVIRLYIEKYNNLKLPYGKIHKYLLMKSISKPDEKKKKQRRGVLVGVLISLENTPFTRLMKEVSLNMKRRINLL